MGKFKQNLQEIRRKTLNNLRRIAFEGMAFSVFLIVVSLVLFSNVVRVIATGKNNYETYLKERDALAEIRKKNEELKNEYEYVNSDEFKKLILRDAFSIASQEERLFRTKDQVRYFDEEVELLKLEDKKDFIDWWLQLIR